MNKVAFITGASRGIGREAALAFARAGFDLAISARTLNEGEQHEHALRDAAGAPWPAASMVLRRPCVIWGAGCSSCRWICSTAPRPGRLPGGAGRVRAHRRADQ